jgi:hypothetical protein
MSLISAGSISLDSTFKNRNIIETKERVRKLYNIRLGPIEFITCSLWANYNLWLSSLVVLMKTIDKCRLFFYLFSCLMAKNERQQLGDDYILILGYQDVATLL